MSNIKLKYIGIDRYITEQMGKIGLRFLRISIGVIFTWFGVLKFFEGLSPAEDIAVNTISLITFELIDDKIILIGLAVWETLIGIGLLFNLFMRVTLLLLYLQMIGTFLPIFLFPGEVFIKIPYAPTLEGQYIFKNFIIIGAGIVLGSKVGGARMKVDKPASGTNDSDVAQSNGR